MQEGVREAAGWVAAAGAVTVLTGAGISTDSGIPDFRGPQGVWTKNPAAEKMATLQYYLSDPDVRRQAWQTRISSTRWAAEPNPGHRAIVDLERSGRLVAVVTQNVDGLHQAAGSTPELVVEVHGSMHWTMCWGCRDRRPMDETLERVRAGEDDPPCLVCGGILKSATISFGQDLEPDVLDRAVMASGAAEVFVAAGTSLGVYPAAGLVPLAKRKGARLIIANAQPTPYDDIADAVFRGGLSEVLPELLR